ncbi:MAG: hypothetical protein AAGC71_11615 [Pseudomonadota bacterium]
MKKLTVAVAVSLFAFTANADESSFEYDILENLNNTYQDLLESSSNNWTDVLDRVDRVSTGLRDNYDRLMYELETELDRFDDWSSSSCVSSRYSSCGVS